MKLILVLPVVPPTAASDPVVPRSPPGIDYDSLILGIECVSVVLKICVVSLQLMPERYDDLQRAIYVIEPLDQAVVDC